MPGKSEELSSFILVCVLFNRQRRPSVALREVYGVLHANISRCSARSAMCSALQLFKSADTKYKLRCVFRVACISHRLSAHSISLSTCQSLLRYCCELQLAQRCEQRATSFPFSSSHASLPFFAVKVYFARCSPPQNLIY